MIQKCQSQTSAESKSQLRSDLLFVLEDVSKLQSWHFHSILIVFQLKCCIGMKHCKNTRKELKFSHLDPFPSATRRTRYQCLRCLPLLFPCTGGINSRVGASTWAISFLKQSTLDQMDVRSGHSAPSLQIEFIIDHSNGWNQEVCCHPTVVFVFRHGSCFFYSINQSINQSVKFQSNVIYIAPFKKIKCNSKCFTVCLKNKNNSTENIETNAH